MRKRSNNGILHGESGYRTFWLLIPRVEELMPGVFLPSEQAVCCEDEIHCCPKGSTCDVKQLKCVSASTKKEMPMWAKLPARKIAAWENQKGQNPSVVLVSWF